MDKHGPRSTLYVGDLSKEVTEGLLYTTFHKVAPVKSINLSKNSKETLEHAYITFEHESDADKALETLNFQILEGIPMRISRAARDSSEITGGNNIYIGNLHKDIDNQTLHDTFSCFGEIISCKVALDENGRSKGYGFINFETEEVANTVIENVNGKLIKEQIVFVYKAMPRKERERKELGDTDDYTNVFVKNFEETLNDKQLFEMFFRFGPINSCTIMRSEDGKSKGIGFVDFVEHSSAAAAVLQLNYTLVDGKILEVKPAIKTSERQSGTRVHQGINLFVKNLHYSINDYLLYELFSPYGTIISAVVLRNDDETSRCFGFVRFSLEEEARQAIYEMDNKIVKGKQLCVKLAQTKEERASQMNSMQLALNQTYPQSDASYNIPTMVPTPAHLDPQISPLSAQWAYPSFTPSNDAFCNIPAMAQTSTYFGSQIPPPQAHLPYLTNQIYDMQNVEGVHGSETRSNMILSDTPASAFSLSQSFDTLNISSNRMAQAERSFPFSSTQQAFISQPPFTQQAVTSQLPIRQRSITSLPISIQGGIASQTSSTHRFITPQSSATHPVTTSLNSPTHDTITCRSSETQQDITSPFSSTREAKR